MTDLTLTPDTAGADWDGNPFCTASQIVGITYVVTGTDRGKPLTPATLDLHRADGEWFCALYDCPPDRAEPGVRPVREQGGWIGDWTHQEVACSFARDAYHWRARITIAPTETA